MRKQIVIDFETGQVGIYYADGFVGDLSTFVESELTRPWIETRSALWAASDFAADL